LAISLKSTTPKSLKTAFLKRFFWGTLIVWFIAATISYFVARHELGELYDGELAQTARIILSLYSDSVSTDPNKTQVTSSAFEGGENYERKLVFQLWDSDKQLLLRSANSPLTPLVESLGVFETNEIGDNKVRTLGIRSPNSDLIVQVGQNVDFRNEAIAETLEPLMLFLLIALPLSLFLVNRALNKGLRPLTNLSNAIAKRTGENLSIIDTADAPLEISGIVEALNKLMTRVKETMGRERQFIADAAHELRTPLAGIKAQAQVALNYPEHQNKSLSQIVDGVDRTTRLANQLLTLSDVDSLSNIEKASTVNLAQLIGDVIRDLSVFAEEKDQTIDINIENQLKVQGDDALLYTLFRNLIENAIKYSPKKTVIRINGSKETESLKISIQDQGEGIPEHERQRVFDRFYRKMGTEERGSGLGLAIANNIARLHNATIRLSSTATNNGLMVTVSFN
jgi:two-component system sensor histidine kinase QseC